MTKGEVEDVIRDVNRQMDVIAFSGTKAGARKRDELQFRIDYLKELLRTK